MDGQNLILVFQWIVFVKKITFQEITKKGLKTLGPTLEVMAAAEQLEGHKRAVTVRLESF